MLKAIRKRKNITQKELANRLGISQGYLSKLENKSFYHMDCVSTGLMRKISCELNVCPLMLFFYFYGCQYNCLFNIKKTE